jgi:PAS domain S-box-containing protein
LNETPIFKALSEPENNYFNMVRQAINDIGIGVGIIDKNMNIIWFNKNMHEWIGKKPEETNGKHCYCTFKNNKEICIKCPGALTLKDGKVHEAVQDGINKNGKIMYFYLTTSPLYDLDKKVVGFVEMVKEISHCDNIRKELEELKSRLKS